jgi:hypothetical protein
MSNDEPHDSARLTALEARQAALEARQAALEARQAALEARQAAQKPAREQRHRNYQPSPIGTAAKVRAVLVELGGVATVAQLRAHLPTTPNSSIRRTCQELRNAGQLRQTAWGIYELPPDEPATS